MTSALLQTCFSSHCTTRHRWGKLRSGLLIIGPAGISNFAHYTQKVHQQATSNLFDQTNFSPTSFFSLCNYHLRFTVHTTPPPVCYSLSFFPPLILSFTFLSKQFTILATCKFHSSDSNKKTKRNFQSRMLRNWKSTTLS